MRLFACCVFVCASVWFVLVCVSCVCVVVAWCVCSFACVCACYWYCLCCGVLGFVLWLWVRGFGCEYLRWVLLYGLLCRVCAFLCNFFLVRLFVCLCLSLLGCIVRVVVDLVLV